MQTGPITKRGKAKSSKNALTHGLTSQNLISTEEQDLYGQIIAQLNSEYEPATFTEQILVERVASHYVRLHRAINAEAASIEKEKLAIRNSIPIKETFGLTDDQSKAYAVAWSKGLLTANDEQEDNRQIIIQGMFRELVDLFSTNELTNTAPLKSNNTILGLVFSRVAGEAECTIDELFDGRYRSSQIIKSAMTLGDAAIGNRIISTGEYQRSVSVSDFFDDLLKECGELTIALNIHPSVKKLEGLTNSLGLAQAQDLDKINRHLTNADRQFSKALGELRHVVEERRRKEALNPAA